MMKIIFYIYLILCIGLGIWRGLAEWGGAAGVIGGGFIGLITGLALFVCFTITVIAAGPLKKIRSKERRTRNDT